MCVCLQIHIQTLVPHRIGHEPSLLTRRLHTSSPFTHKCVLKCVREGGARWRLHLPSTPPRARPSTPPSGWAAPHRWILLRRTGKQSSETLDDIACAVVTRVTPRLTLLFVHWVGGGGIRTRVLGVSGSYTVVLGRGVVVIMAFPQLQSQSLQSVQLVQSRHAFLDEGHHPGRKTIHSLIGSPVHPEGAHTHQDSVSAASQTPNAKKKKLNWLYIYKSFLRQNQFSPENIFLCTKHDRINFLCCLPGVSGLCRGCGRVLKMNYWTKYSWLLSPSSLCLPPTVWSWLRSRLASVPSGPRAVIDYSGLVCGGTQRGPGAPWETTDKYVWHLLWPLSAAEW